jgi:hypothetical protein
MTKPCILSDRIYVPVEYVNDSILDQFTYELKNENPDDENPFEVIKGVIKTYVKYEIRMDLNTMVLREGIFQR